MNVDKLVQMANQIGSFFAAMPDPAEAREGIALHLRKFWEPRMRALILARAKQGEASGLLPLVQEAILENEVTLQTQHGVVHD